MKIITTKKVEVRKGVDYGYGIDIRTHNDINRYGHNGGVPRSNACFYYYEPNDYTLIILSNYDPRAAERVAIRCHGFISGIE